MHGHNTQHPDYQHPSPLDTRVTSDPGTSTTEESPQDQFFDPPVQQRGIDSLELANLTANIQTELDLDHPDPIEPAPPHTSPALHTMSSRGAANSLAHISDTLDDATMASPPPV